MKLNACLLLLTGLTPALCFAQDYVADTFADGERATQNPPDSLQWFSTFAGSMSVSPGALRIAPTNSTVRAATAYFTAANARVTLGLGERITFSLTFTPTTTAATSSPNGLRLGLFDSGGVRLTGDANPTDNSYRGYAAFVNPLNTASRIQERIGTGALITSLGTGIYDSNLVTGASSGETLNFEAGESYVASLWVTRSMANQWLVGFSLTGGNLGLLTFEAEDTSGVVTSFDTISFGLNSDMGVTDFTQVAVVVSAIPEPGTMGAGLGAAAMLGAWFWRRRKVHAGRPRRGAERGEKGRPTAT